MPATSCLHGFGMVLSQVLTRLVAVRRSRVIVRKNSSNKHILLLYIINTCLYDVVVCLLIYICSLFLLSYRPLPHGYGLRCIIIVVYTLASGGESPFVCGVQRGCFVIIFPIFVHILVLPLMCAPAASGSLQEQTRSCWPCHLAGTACGARRGHPSSLGW